MSDDRPKVVCFSCKFGWGYLSDETEMAAHLNGWVPIICSGKIDTIHILEAFRRGADGVLILGCRSGDCHFQDGNIEARKRVQILQRVLESYGIEKERLRIELSMDPEGGSIPLLIEEMRSSISGLGPIKRISGPGEEVRVGVASPGAR